jgi:alpha-glutamyl/putrescinyl thymine pyrophosphorylase clade 1
MATDCGPRRCTDGGRRCNVKLLHQFEEFIVERQAIRTRRESGRAYPWTDDPILRDFRFCNVEREQDQGTKDLARLWRDPHKDDPDLWFALAVYRRGFNYGPTAEALGYPVPWKPAHYIRVMDHLRESGTKWLSPAYTLPPNAGAVPTAGRSYAELSVEAIFDPLWARREFVRPRPNDTLRSFYDRLDQQYLCRGFYAGQIVADLKYAQLTEASDWDSFAVPGPGSEQGLNFVIGRDHRTTWTRKEPWLIAFEQMRRAIRLPFALDAQDLQNCLCEYAKYKKIQLGVSGRRRKFTAVDRTEAN